MTKHFFVSVSVLLISGTLTISPAMGQDSEERGGFKVIRHDGAMVITRDPDGAIRTLEELSRIVKAAPPSSVVATTGVATKALAAFLVSDAGDAPDADLTDNVFAPATLRSAIENANKEGLAASISFASGLTTISPATALPSVTVPVTVDGSVAAGKVILDGALVSNGTGLRVPSNSTVQNVSFQHWLNIGLALGTGTTNMTVKRCAFIANKIGLNMNSTLSTIGGDDPQDGNVAVNNTQQGISLVYTTDITIKNNLVGTKDGITAAPNTGSEGIYVLGTRTRVLHNVISGNYGNGLVIGEFSINTLVKDNIVGLDSTGQRRLGNGGSGIQSFGDGDSIIANVVSGNSWGINILYQSADDLVQGNLIGPNRTLDSLFSNTSGGINAGGYPMRVDSNVISGNGGNGIHINGAGNVTVTRNRIGTDPTGTLDWGNQWAGIYIGCDFNTIGGSTPSEGNLLSGNGGGGIEMYGGTTLVFGGPSQPNLVQGNVIQHNRIGTDVTGTQRIPNFTGLFMNGHIDSNFVRDNLISGNQNHGVWTRRSPSAPRRNIFQRNLIGTQANGTSPLPNDSCGVMIDSAGSNIWGGINDGEGNTIAFSNLAGIAVKAGWGTKFQRNSIHHNQGMAIDLGNDGPTPNDSGDVDLGPNRRQNFPRITWIHNAGGSTTVKGRLESKPLTPFRLEFYTNEAADSTGFGEAQTYQTSTDVVTDTAGRAPFEVTIPGTFGRVVGTATDPDYGTSEVSKAPFVVNSIADRPDANPGDGLASTSGPQVNGVPEVTLRSALQASNHVIGEDDITFDIPGGGSQFIIPQSQLPQAIGDVTIDGTTQPGYTPGAVQVIQVLGANAGSSATGLRLAGDRTTVRGIYVSAFTGNGIDATGSHLLLADVTANGNKGIGVRSTHDVTLEGESIFSGNGPAGPSASTCNDQEGGGIEVAGLLRGSGRLTASGNCGPGIKVTSTFYEASIDYGGSVTASNNGGTGVWSSSEVVLRGERFEFNSNGRPTKWAYGVLTSDRDIVIDATGAGPGPNIFANSNSANGLHAYLGSVRLHGRAQSNNNGAGLTTVEAFNRKVTGIWARGHVRTQDVEVKSNGLDGIKAGESIIIEGNAVASNHPGRGLWGIINITLDGTDHLLENNLDGAIWAANGFLRVKGTLTVRRNTVGGHHGEEESPDRTNVLVGAVEAYKFVSTESILFEDNLPTGLSSWGNLQIHGNAVVRRSGLRGIHAHGGITIHGTQHAIVGNGGDGITAENGALVVRGHILLEGNGGSEGEGLGAYSGYIDLDDVTSRGNHKSGLASRTGMRIRGRGIVTGNQGHGISSNGPVLISGGRICDNRLFGIEAPTVRMSGTEICNNGRGGVSGKVETAPPPAGRTIVEEVGSPARRSLMLLTPPLLSSSIIRGSSITGNAGAGILVDSPYPFFVEGSNISGNSGFAISASGGGSVTAAGNWWGSAAGPGAGLSGSVTATSWLNASVGVYVGVGIDSVYVLPGDSGSIGLVAANWSAVTDSLIVGASDSRGWLTPVADRSVALADSSPSVTMLTYSIPAGASPGDTSRILVLGSSQTMPGSTGADTLYFVVYTPSLHEIAILADTIVAAPGDTVHIAAAGFDQAGRGIEFAPTWTSTGGTIDTSGIYSVGPGTGLFIVRVADTVAGLTDSVYVRVILPLGAVPGTIAVSAGTVNAGNVQAGTEALLPFSITNTSGGILRIDSLRTLTTAFSPVWDPSINLLRAGDTLAIAILFAPPGAAAYADTLYVYNSSPTSPLKVPMSGNGSLTGVIGGADVPAVYSLDQNYPNPFNPTTSIRFGLPVMSRVRLTVHDILGREIATLADGIQKEGFVTVTWSPRVASGVYFVRIEATAVGDANRRFVNVRRMVLVK